MPTEMNLHRDALCFMVKTQARHKTTETVVGGWQQLVVGGWQLVAGGGGWGSKVGGGRRLAVGVNWGLSLRAVLTKAKLGFLRTALKPRHRQALPLPPVPHACGTGNEALQHEFIFNRSGWRANPFRWGVALSWGRGWG